MLRILSVLWISFAIAGTPCLGREVATSLSKVTSASGPALIAFQPKSSSGKVRGASRLMSLEAASSTGDANFTYNIQRDFNASGSMQTTSGTITAGSKTLTTAQATTILDYKIGHGILVAGAGGGATDLVTTVSSISSSTITLRDAAATSVARALVQHDDTAATQKAADSSITTASTFWPRGVYRINAPLNPNCNAQICLPLNKSGAGPYTLRWVGEVVARTSANAPPLTGVVVISDRVSGSGVYPSLIAAQSYTSTRGGLSQFNYVAVELENMYFRTAPNPSISVLNFHNAIDAILKNVQIDPGTNYFAVGAPTNVQSTGIILPGVNNHAQIYLEDVSLYGFYNGISFSEHTVLNNIAVSHCQIAVLVEFGVRPGEGKLTLEQCPVFVKFIGDATVNLRLNIERYDTPGEWFSSAAGQDIVAADGVNARGKIEYNLTIANVGFTSNNLSTTGTSNLNLINLYTGTSTKWGIR